MLILQLFYRLSLFSLLFLAFIFSLCALEVGERIRCQFDRGGFPVSRLRKKIIRFFACGILRLFHIQVHSNLNSAANRLGPAKVYVCNHMSYLDAIILLATLDATFVTSTEIGGKPGLGTICRLVKCIFVNRKNFRSLPKEIAEISTRLKAGENIVFFPEGTTSSGHFLHKFKSPLLQAAIHAEVDIVPITVNLYRFNQRSPLLEDRDYYCWYGTMDFIPHLIRLCMSPPMEIQLIQHAPLELQHLKHGRKWAARTTREQIEKVFRPIEILV